MQQKYFFSMCMVLLFALVSMQCVSALTVSPAKYSVVDGEPVLKTFTLRNEESYAQTVTVSFEEELAPYAQTAFSEIVVEPNAQRDVIIAMVLPELAPGRHELAIVFRTQSSQGQVNAAAEIVPKIFVNKPYPDAYVEYAFAVQDDNNPLQVTLLMDNLGERETTITPTIQLADVSQTKEAILLAPKSSSKANYDISFSQKGTHIVLLALASTNNPQVNNQELEKIIHVGTPVFRIANISTFTNAQGIETLSVPITSDWNGPLPVIFSGEIRNATHSVHVFGRTQQTLAMQDSISLFWEPETSGTYTLSLDFTGDFFTTTLEAPFVSQKEQTFRIHSSITALGILLVLLVLLVIWRITIRK